MSDARPPDEHDPTAGRTAPPRGFGLPGEALRGAAPPTGPVEGSPVPPVHAAAGPAGPPSSRGRYLVTVGIFVLALLVAVGVVAVAVLGGDDTEEADERSPREVASSITEAPEPLGPAVERPATLTEGVACELDLDVYSQAIAAFVALEGEEPQDEQRLLAAALLEEVSEAVDVEVVDGRAVAVPTPGGPCDVGASAGDGGG